MIKGFGLFLKISDFILFLYKQCKHALREPFRLSFRKNGREESASRSEGQIDEICP